MPTPEIEEFAENLMKHVRDLSIQSCDMRLQPPLKSQTSRRWKAAMSGDPEDLIRTIIPDVVDHVLFRLLDAIDGGAGLFYRASNGKMVDLEIEGLAELAGWFKGKDGWIDQYSKERRHIEVVAANYP